MNNKIYDEWEEKYRNVKILNPMDYLKEKTLETLQKLNIKVENRQYTEYEYEVFKGEISIYYKEDDYSKEDLEFVKSLKGTGVTQKEYDELISNINEIDEMIYIKV